MVAMTTTGDECFPLLSASSRVLDEILQKLVHLVQEEECVSWIIMQHIVHKSSVAFRTDARLHMPHRFVDTRAHPVHATTHKHTLVAV